MTNKLKSLVGIMEVRFLQRQTTFAKIVAEENRLRAELAKIDQLASDAQSKDDAYLKAIGADVIWNAWVGKTKSQLNRELALVLAQKNKILGSVRREFGKLLSAEQLLKQHNHSVEQQRLAHRLSNAIDQHVQKN